MRIEFDADPGESSPLYRKRHSLAHVMAQAVTRMRPGTVRGFGPPTDTGFYYDFILSAPISPDDFEEIESVMAEIIDADQEFTVEELPLEDAVARLLEMKEPLKAEYARELAAKHNLDNIRFYVNGPFVDMCEGPHVSRTSELMKGTFKIRSVSGAYWRARSDGQPMTRIHAWCFETPGKLREQVRRFEALSKNDHKELGRQLDLFELDPLVGRGLPLWLPNGTVVRDELENLAKEEEFRGGYVRVATPHITRDILYQQSGHLDLYRDKMYPPMTMPSDNENAPEEIYYLKPMNCPHHHRIFAARPRSHHDLPIRYAEYGAVYRYEASGEISGLLRVRGMVQNDAHIYCTREQVRSEMKEVLKLHMRYFDLLGIKLGRDYYIRLSRWDPDDPRRRNKYVDAPEIWPYAESEVREALRELDLEFREATGEAAYYGPKIDFQFRTVRGREESFCTCQLDFAVPAEDRMNLTYTAADGSKEHPFIIHRAPLGSHERFVAYLIEHFRGAFPTWLAPTQVRVVPVSEKTEGYASEVCDALRAEFVRAEVDRSSDTIGKKLRRAISEKIPIALVVGPKEAEARQVTVRRYAEKEQEVLGLEEFMERLRQEIATREMRRAPEGTT